jgi:hypothetical protein
MKKKAAAHLRDCVACETYTGQNRLRRKIGLEGLAVRRFDLGMVDKTSQGDAGCAISLCRWRPIYLLDGAAGLSNGRRKRGKPKVEHTGALPKKIHRLPFLRLAD